MKNKKIIIICSIVLVLFVFCTLFIKIKLTGKNNIINNVAYNVDIHNTDSSYPSCIKSETIDNINESFFDISIDLNNKMAVVDDEEVSLTKLFDINDEQLNNVISSNFFESFLKDNLVGDVAYSDGKIQISNPYSTDVIIVETEDNSIFNNDENIDEVKEAIDDIYLVKYNNAKNTKKGYEELENNSKVINISTDEMVSICDSQVDISSISNYAWGTSFSGMDTYTNYLTSKGENNIVKVAVLDTGIYSSHEVFSSEEEGDRIDYSYSFNYVDGNNNVTDDNGHGTSVAGVIAQSTPDCVKIIPIKIMNSKGKGKLTDIYNGIHHVYAYADIINISLGLNTDDLTSKSKALYESFLKKVYNSGVTICCAAGNSGADSIEFPASSQYTLAASSINGNKKISSFSNYGSSIDFAMPGENLVLPDYSGKSKYSVSSGTSFSSPYLASACALIKVENPSYNNEEIVEELKSNVEDLGDPGKDNYYGYGVVNFNVNKFKKPIFVNIETLNTNWGKNNTIKFSAISPNPIVMYALTNSSSTPEDDDWILVSNTNNIEKEIYTSYSGLNYIWIKDSNSNVVNKEIYVDYIDNESPCINNEISLVDVSKSSAKFSISVYDSKSGLNKVVWNIYNENGSLYTTKTTEINTLGSDNSIVIEQEIKDLDSSKNYTANAIIYDNLDNFVSSKIVNFNTNNDKISTYFVNNGNTYEKIEFDEDYSKILNKRKEEFENELKTIKNNYLQNKSESIDFGDYSSLFVETSDEYSYPKILSDDLIESYSSDGTKYYVLNYEICYIKKQYDLSNINDISMNYNTNNVLLTHIDLSKDDYTIYCEDNNVVKVTVDDSSNIYLSSNNYAGSTSIKINVLQTNKYISSSKTINVEVNPIIIKPISAIVDQKEYDGTNNAKVLNVEFEGLLVGDNLVLGKDYEATAFFENENISNDKLVYVNVKLKDTDLAKRYSLSTSTLVSSGDIIAKIDKILKGDLDRNGVVDSNDASLALYLYKVGNWTNEDIEIGDIDNNNVVDSNDASLALYLYKVGNWTNEDIEIGDIDNNNIIDSNDASLILEMYKEK